MAEARAWNKPPWDLLSQSCRCASVTVHVNAGVSSSGVLCRHPPAAATTQLQRQEAHPRQG